MKPYSLDYTSGSPTPSGDIVWSGPTIDCLGICPGQTLNKVTNIIATKVCELAAPLDLSTLTLQCALDIFNREENGNRTLANVLQLLADNDCGLKELIDGLQAQIDGLSQDNLVLDLKCLAEKDSFGNLLPYNQETVLQSLINHICDLELEVDGIGGKITDLQDQIDEIKDNLPSSDEKIITTCIIANKPVSESVIELSDNYCNYKESVGQTTDIQKAIAQQPKELQDLLSAIKGWEINPANLAESTNNIWIAVANLLSRVSSIESTCCNITCKDVTVGMEIIGSADGKAFYLKFSEAAGTDIPAGFSDRGSTVTITDKNGKIITYDIEVEQDGTTDQLSVVGLNLDEPLTISVAARVGSDSLTCEKCLVGEFDAISSCPVCAISVTGKTGYVTIIYETP